MFPTKTKQLFIDEFKQVLSNIEVACTNIYKNIPIFFQKIVEEFAELDTSIGRGFENYNLECNKFADFLSKGEQSENYALYEDEENREFTRYLCSQSFGYKSDKYNILHNVELDGKK